MAAYAALTSLMQIIDQLEHHPFPPISLDRQQVESLTEIVTFLQEFLEGYDSPFVDRDEADPLEMRIADAAYAAEDLIESYIVENIHFAATETHDDEVNSSSGDETNNQKKKIGRFFNCFRGSQKPIHDGKKTKNEVVNNLSLHLYQDVCKVIVEMDFVKKEVMEMMREKQLQRNIFRSLSFTGKINSTTMVGFDDVLLQLLDKLTGGSSSRQVIPITGMGGIGKTTLAQNIFQHALIKEYFDICAWVTISQQYNTKEILSKILYQASGEWCEKSEEQLGDELHKCLFRRRYLIIMDDIWSIEVWEKMRLYFPDCDQGSRVVVTTRQSFLTSQLTSDPNNGLHMKFLDEVNSWNLFSKSVFGEKSFPLQLEKIGKKIVKNCRGLPLSIVVIGGLLAKSEHTQKHWEHIEEKLNSIVNSENNEYCLKILKLSYNHLPAHLKPSFLYMGIFEEDTRIRVSTLIKLWVSEGFLKREHGKSLETIGEGFLTDLIERNLILVDGLGSTGNIKYCKMHDLLRDLCLKEAEKERFYHVIGQHRTQAIHKHNRRHMVYPDKTSRERVLDALEFTASHVRSFTSQSQYDSFGLLPKFRLLRILNANEGEFPDYSFQYVIRELLNSRYVAINTTNCWKIINLPPSMNFLWNLHTLRIVCGLEDNKIIIAPVEIWKMSQLRHVEFLSIGLPDPPSGSNIVILENLQTLKRIVNFKCGEDLVKRIPNIKRLLIRYEQHVGMHYGDDYCLNNLECLHKLESLTMWVYRSIDHEFLQNITFPQSLRKLSLDSHHINLVGWEEMLNKMGGSLPLLQKLTLKWGVFKTGKWETVEGQFPSLKFLELRWCRGLKYWTTESSHFPCLEHLYLAGLEELEKIPLEISEIPTLQSIELSRCSKSVVQSAKKIAEEQEELYGGEQQLPFLVRVKEWFFNQDALQSLASPNFQFEWL